ncbi:hypothetical protein CANARDRAFT_201742 [[Candida] arabinofermentans NRRL YB-2248]|uniref:Thioredoxin domain-containing protein n=1 Tax=[Candida] arabinofermentans NRRL YB-2248 TaxID=983967 RepID=A0A1E4SX30_9ASCO|nr:hypothetical protein CANARDRAFT_201742 [[Candida] arabinofermentans NRRL YB-2248]
MISIQVGDKIPDTTLYEKNPTDKLSIAKEFAKKRALILGVPGAFSGACSEVMIPGYRKHLPDFISKGYEAIIVVSVNDAFVMNAWKQSFKLEPGQQTIFFLADPEAEFTKTIGMDFDAVAFFGNIRSKRYVLAIDKGEVIAEFVEPENTPVDVTAAEKVLKALPGLE